MNAASQIWPHLAHDDERVVKPSKGSVADAMWPQLSREQKARDRDAQLWNEILRRQRESFREARMREKG